MKVYGVYTGCQYEGGDVERVFAKKNSALAYADDQAETYARLLNNNFHNEESVEVEDTGQYVFIVQTGIFAVRDYIVEYEYIKDA